MKIKLNFITSFTAGIILSTSCFGAVVFDDFSGGSINSSLWNTMTTGPDSSISTSSGNAIFRNRGRLTTVDTFQGSEINGRLRFTDSPSDLFKTILRTDGTFQNNQYQETANGIMIEITSSSNWDSDASRNVRIIDVVNGNQVQGGLVLSMNTFYDFRIVDSGSSVSAYVGNLSQPLITLNTSATYGEKISFYNREEIGSINHVTHVDYISIVPEPTSLTLTAVASLLFLGRRKARN
jgi:hypothetical protein